MNRLLALLLALLLLPAYGLVEDEDDWDGWDDWDWRALWEEEGYFDFCDVQDGTLIIFEGVTALGWADDDVWDDELGMDVETEPKFESGPGFARDTEGGDFHRVSFPSTLRYLGMESFCFYHFIEFTLPAQLEVLEHLAFYACTFDVLRVETILPAEDVLEGLYDCYVSAYEAPEDHPLYKSVDGVLFSKDGKTLLAYPNYSKAEHYDVPAGVERIEAGAFGNEYLKTISLPIGLKSVGDYGFAGCTRLQSIALPLTVKEIGKGIFNECVSLELVSLPEGMEAVRDENYYWAEYYPDDAIFRGDNGDTLGGERSEGRIDAPGRLYKRQEDTDLYDKELVKIYNSPEATTSHSSSRNGKIVYLGAYRNGRVALYEPLSDRSYRNELGWADIEDVQYLPQESLFRYADILPRETMNVWWDHLPDYASWVSWETTIPLENREYDAELFGPYVRFQDSYSRAVFACRVEDAVLTREPDGTENVYGIVHYHKDRYKTGIQMLDKPNGQLVKVLESDTKVRVLDEEGEWVQITDGKDTGWVKNSKLTNTLEPDILLRDAPEGGKVKTLIGGTQVQILDETEAWYQVTDGRDTGWVEKVQVKIVPEE